MSEPESGKARRPVPWGLVGMIGLVVLIEGFVARRGLDFQEVDDWAYSLTAKKAARKDNRYDVLCFGESLVKLGVIPRAIRERSGLSAYNLAVSGSQSPSSYFLLKRVIESGARPKAVVVDFFPPQLRVGPRHNLTHWASLLTVAEAAQLSWWARDADLFATLALGRILPSYFGRIAVREHIAGAVSGKPDVRRYHSYSAIRHWNKYEGAQLMPVSPSVSKLTDEQLDEYLRGFYPEFYCHPANLEGVERFLTLAAEHKIPVYWVLPPISPALQDRMARSGFDARHEAFIRSYQARFSNVTVVDGRGTISDPAGFFDPNHLAGEGAYVFTQALADALKGPPASGPRWVALPLCRPEPLPAGVEDYFQGLMAQQARATAVR